MAREAHLSKGRTLSRLASLPQHSPQHAKYPKTSTTKASPFKVSFAQRPSACAE